MFTRMLRPSRRHVHERISQQDDGSNTGNSNNSSGNNNVNNSSVVNNNTNSPVDRQTGPSIVVLGGGGGGENGIAPIGSASQHDLNLTEEGRGGESSRQASSAAGGGNGNINNNAVAANRIGIDPSNPGADGNRSGEIAIMRPAVGVDGSDDTDEDDDDDDDDDDGILQPNDGDDNPASAQHPFLTSQLQAERELRQRRQSTCTLLILFFLIRLWIEAIIEKDVGLIFLSMMGTTWTYRWLVTRREAEEEYDRQLLEEGRNARGGEGIAAGSARGEAGAEGGASGADAAINFDPDLGLMSFQAQLALAILESQRQMFENGGYGGNDRSSVHDGPGVTGEAKKRWKGYEWGDCEATTAELAGMSRASSLTNIGRTGSSGSSGGGDYGSVGTVDLAADEDGLDKPSASPSKLEGGLLTSFDDDEEPSCSICLCEYERGERVTRLPCDHVYHESCLDSWTKNHVRCPLCNFDLMEGFERPVSAGDRARARQHAEEQRAFRNMALSTLGRRIRTRRTSAANGRRAVSSRASAAAALVAAAEDSIV